LILHGIVEERNRNGRESGGEEERKGKWEGSV